MLKQSLRKLKSILNIYIYQIPAFYTENKTQSNTIVYCSHDNHRIY